MIRTNFIYLFILCISLLGCQTENKVLKPNKRPNILFILVDDLGVKDLGFSGSKYYETPHINQLANQAFRFTQGYATSRVCSPSRASIFTGQFTARHGITDWIGAKTGEAWRTLKRHDKLLPANYVYHLPMEDITLAEAMKKAGYTTFFAGKWHLGSEGSYPEDHGFDFNQGGWEKGSPIGGYFSPWENPKLNNLRNGENLSMRLAKETAHFIESHRDSTFFAFLSFYAVHGPIQTTQKKWNKYRTKAIDMGLAERGYQMERVLPIRQVQDNPIYAGLVESMDDAVGHVLGTLEALGLDDNTIVVFTSDNGGVASGDAFSTSNLPLRGGKGYQWEGGIREPYLIKVPWVSKESKTVDYPVTGADFYPTLLDLANVDLYPEQHVDGISLKPLIENLSTLMPNRPLYWHYPHYGNQGGEPSSIIRKDNWKLIHYWEDDRDELYRLDEDPGELHDLAKIQTDLTSKLSAELISWLKGVNAQIPQTDPEYNLEAAEKRRYTLETELLTTLEQNRKEMLSSGFSPNSTWWDSKVTID